MLDLKTKLIIAGIIIIIIALFIGNKIYDENDYLSLYLICDYNSKYTNYEEKLEFNFVDKTLYEYERFEVMYATEKTPLKEIEKMFNEQYEKVKNNFSDYFKYEITTMSNYVSVHTYIKTIFNEEFYNSYISEKGIKMESTLEEIRDKLSEEYTCHTEKRG